MKHITALLPFFLSSLATASPLSTRDTDPPWGLWPTNDGGDFIKLVNHTGTGCPSTVDDIWINNLDRYADNTNHWVFSYPDTMSATQKEPYKWCETVWSYDSYHNKTSDIDYVGPLNPRLHKNGSYIQSRYKLANGDTATWKTTYYLPDNKEVVDSLTVKGPFDNATPDPFENTIGWQFSPEPKTWDLPCQKGTFRIKTEVIIDAKGNGSAVVPAEQNTPPRYLSGISFDWRTCKL